jgi:opacity protein-like surface antigen
MFRAPLLTTFCLLGLVSPSQAADLAPVPALPILAPVSDTELRITPFFWASGIKGDVRTRALLPTVGVDVPFSDILQNLDFAAMLAGEYRSGRWGVLADLAYVAVSVGAERKFIARAPGFSSAEVKSRTLNATATGFYRFYENGGFSADILAGARVWSASTDVDLLLGGVVAASGGTDRTWIDPVAGLRLRANLGNGFGLSAYGDIGAGSSRLTWQLRGTIDYKFNENWSVSVGYRHLAVDYRSGSYVFDTALSGPIMGVSYKF